MKPYLKIRYVGTINSINDREDLQLYTDSQDTEFIKEYLTGTDRRKKIRKDIDQFDSFFVKVVNGDYSEVYGFFGIVAILGKSLYSIVLVIPHKT